MKGRIAVLQLEPGRPLVISGSELEMDFAHFLDSRGSGGEPLLRRSALIINQIRFHDGPPRAACDSRCPSRFPSTYPDIIG
jgi:hypothetical protein